MLLGIIWKESEITVLYNIQIFYFVREKNKKDWLKFSLVWRTAESMFSGLPQMKNTDISMAFCVEEFFFFPLLSLPISSMHLLCNKLLQDFCFERSQKATLDSCFQIRISGRVTVQTFK